MAYIRFMRLGNRKERQSGCWIRTATACTVWIFVLLLPLSGVNSQTLSFVIELDSVSEQKINALEAKSSVALRNELRTLDLELFDMLNSIIADEYYNINCNFPAHTQTLIRLRACDIGYDMVAGDNAYRESSALEAFGQLPQELLQELDVLPLTDLERYDREFANLVFELAKDNRRLAQNLMDRHYLQLVLDHRKENWWRRFFRMEVEPILQTLEDSQ